MSMSLKLETGLCCGFGNCAEICPEVFALDEELGKAIILQADVAGELAERARQAAVECPTQAIVVE